MLLSLKIGLLNLIVGLWDSIVGVCGSSVGLLESILGLNDLILSLWRVAFGYPRSRFQVFRNSLGRRMLVVGYGKRLWSSRSKIWFLGFDFK